MTPQAIRDLIQQADEIEARFAQLEAIRRHEAGKSEEQLKAVPVHERVTCKAGELHRLMKSHKRDIQQLQIDGDLLRGEEREHQRMSGSSEQAAQRLSDCVEEIDGVRLEDRGEYVVLHQNGQVATWEK